MIKRHTYQQTTAATSWVVQLPQGASKGRPLAAYAPDGSSIEIDSWTLDTHGVLKVDFGIDPVSGSLEYEYQMDKTHVEDDDKPLVNIEANYGGVNIGSGIFQ